MIIFKYTDYKVYCNEFKIHLKCCIKFIQASNFTQFLYSLTVQYVHYATQI